MKFFHIFSIFLILQTSFLCLKFFYKRNPKTFQLDAFNIPQSPELAKFIYPSIQYYLTKNTKYNPLIPQVDLAQIETNVGVLNPLNRIIKLKIKNKIIEESNNP